MSITRINSLGITDGTIVNADINASAGIVASKLSGVTSEVKVWVNFNATGTPAIRASLNVTSITDNGTGDFTINFTNALTDGNFAVGYFLGDASSSQSAMTASFGASSAMTTTSLRFRSCFNNTGTDSPFDYSMCTFAIFR